MHVDSIMQKRTSTVFVELIDASEYHINSDATAVTPVLAVDKDMGRIRTQNVLQLREKKFVTLPVPRESGAPIDKPHPGKTIRGIVYQRPLRGSFPVSRKLPDRVHNMRDFFPHPFQAQPIIKIPIEKMSWCLDRNLGRRRAAMPCSMAKVWDRVDIVTILNGNLRILKMVAEVLHGGLQRRSVKQRFDFLGNVEERRASQTSLQYILVN